LVVFTLPPIFDKNSTFWNNKYNLKKYYSFALFYVAKTAPTGLARAKEG
jgi:hypothetical protein